jgi:hypothetical protein
LRRSNISLLLTSPKEVEAILAKALSGCSLPPLRVLAKQYGVAIRLVSTVPLDRETARKLANLSALVANDGRTLWVGRGAPYHQVWAVAHCLAHTIQWRTTSPRQLHPRFHISGLEARFWSATPLNVSRGARQGRALRQEFEAHILTASILAACYGDDRRPEFEFAAMAKARKDLDCLSHLGKIDRSFGRQLAKRLSRFWHEIGSAPDLPIPAHLRAGPQRSHDAIPYLIVP